MTSRLRQSRIQQFLSTSLPFIYIGLLTWLLIGPLWAESGLPNSADGTLHLHRSAAMARSWSAGVFWPRWFPAVYQGLGSPVFHYYSPLFYLLVAPLHRAGLNLDLAAKLVITLAFIGSGLATWAWLRRLLPPAAGLAGAALYLSQPHIFRELYFQGDYPQLLAVLLLPVVFWIFTRLYQESDWLCWLLAPVSLATLVVTHNVMAMLGAGPLVLFWLALHLWHRHGRGLLRGIAAAAFAAGLSAFFWLPALADANLVSIGNLQRGFFHFAQYFVPWQDLLAGPPMFDSRAGNPPFPHLLGWAAWLALGAGIAALVVILLRRLGRKADEGLEERSNFAYWIVVGLLLVAACLALTQPWSTPLWRALPPLALVQFPGRLLAPAALGVALTGGAVVAAGGERGSWLLLAALTLAVGLSSSVYLFPHQPFRPIQHFTPEDTQAYERRTSAWGTTSGNEFLPRWAGPPEPRAGQLAQEEFLPPGAEWSWESPHKAVLRAPADAQLEKGAMVLPSHYFPAWRASAGATPVEMEPTSEGLVGLELPGPAGEVVLHWKGTSWQRVGEWLSLLTLIAWAVWTVLVARRGSEGERSGAAPATPLDCRYFVSVGLLLLLLLGRVAIRSMGLGWFQQSSPAGEVGHVTHPMQVQLGGGEQPAMVLLGWEPLSGSPKPGSALRLRAYWQGPPKLREDLHSFLQLYVPEMQRSWASVQNQNPGRIPTDDWMAKLYYVDDLLLQLPEDLPPATYTLAVGMVDGEGQRLAVAENPDDLILLDEVEVKPLSAGPWQAQHPDVGTPAVFDQSLRLQGYDSLADPGGPILRLYWQVMEKPSTDLVAFVHLLNGEGQLAAQFDAPPLDALLPTSQWPAGALLIDRRKIWLPDELESGQYSFLIGLYDRETGRRLSVTPEAGAEDHFVDNALLIPLHVPSE
jgi:hypothetical protein